MHGIKQFGNYIKNDTASPTVLLEVILVTSPIKAHKERYMATTNLPVVYIHTNTDEHSIILLKGILTEFMALVDSKLYRKNVNRDKNTQAM